MTEMPPLPSAVPDAIDNHTHVNMCGVSNPKELTLLVARAQSVGVNQLITVGTDLETSIFAAKAATWHKDVFGAVAMHPTDTDQLDKAAKDKLTELAEQDRVVAIGETGLDFFWLKDPEANCADKNTQIAAFKWHLNLAKQVDKPLMIHNREADDDVYNLLQSEGSPHTVVLHCFSSNIEAARICIERGYYISFSGTVSFKNAKPLQEAAKIVPDELILTETDAPFLTPHPFRGKPNEAYCIPYTLQALAELRGQSPAEVGEIAARNARKAYKLPDFKQEMMEGVD